MDPRKMHELIATKRKRGAVIERVRSFTNNSTASLGDHATSNLRMVVEDAFGTAAPDHNAYVARRAKMGEQFIAFSDDDWSRAVETLRGAVNLFVVARGFGLGIAQEAALKLKETCGLHAEAFSSAEVKHGPMALVRAGFPVLMFTQRDETRVGIQELSAEFAARGARVLIAGAEAAGAISLPAIASHPVVEPLLTIQSFYRMANELALARGLDPDRPPHLNKVTETV